MINEIILPVSLILSNFYYLVLPKVYNISLEPSDNFVENNLNFSVNCFLIANASNKVEFLFRSKQNSSIQSLRKLQSKLKEGFLWVSTLERKLVRENIGEYFCRDTNNVESQVTISLNLPCMNFCCYHLLYYFTCKTVTIVSNAKVRK